MSEKLEDEKLESEKLESEVELRFQMSSAVSIVVDGLGEGSSKTGKDERPIPDSLLGRELSFNNGVSAQAQEQKLNRLVE